MSDKVLMRHDMGNFMPKKPRETPWASMVKRIRKQVRDIPRWQVILSIAMFLTFISITLIATCVSTEHWIEHKVDRDTLAAKALSDSRLKQNLQDNPAYFTYGRGIFRSCFQGGDAQAMLQKQEHNLGNICLREQAFTLSSLPDGADKFMEIRVHLLRTMAAFIVASLSCYFIAILMGILASFLSHVRLLKGTVGFIFIGLVVDAIGMALFFIVQYIENKKTEYPMYRGGWVIGSEHEYLIDSSKDTYGYSSIIGWISLAPAGVAVVLCFITVSDAQKDIKNRNRPKSWYDTARSNASRSKKASSIADGSTYYAQSIDRNPAYDYAENNSQVDSFDLEDMNAGKSSYS